MKRKSLLFLLLFALLAPWAANAQTVTIGTGSSSHHSAPIANYFNYSLCEMLFTSAEIGTTNVNTILSLGFEGAAASSKTYGITVYMKNVDAESFSANTDYIQVSADDVVYTGSIKPETGWNTIDLTTPFAYDNTKSLLVVVNKTSGGYDSSTSIWKYTSTSSTYKMLYAQTDGSSYDPITLTSLATNYERPNVQLVFGTPSTCAKPTLGAAEYITDEGVSFQWTENGSATQWVLQYSTASDFSNPTEIERSGIPALAITGLSSSTTYYFRLKSVCDGGDESLWSNTVSFTTLCSAQGIPYTYDFEEETPFGCWTPITGVTRANSTSNAHESSYYLRFAGTTSNLVALPQFTPATNTLRVEFWTRPESATSSSCGKFAVGYMTDIADANSFVAVATYNYNDWSSATYVKKSVDLVGVPASANIAMRQFDCATYYYWYVDDVTVKEIPSCLAPTNLAADATTNSAELSWTANSGETAWTLYWKKSTDETYTEVANATNPYTLNGLDAASTYQYYVVANCSADEASEASEVFSFVTECDVITVYPYTENFDSYTAGAGVLPICWSRINKTTNTSYQAYPRINSSYPQSSPNSLYFSSYYSESNSAYDPQDQYAILPEMQNLSSMRIKLSARASYTSDYYDATFHVGIMTDPEDETTFAEVATITPTTTTYELYTIPFDTYTGNGTYIAIKMDAATAIEGFTYAYHVVIFDDITVDEIPSCLEPTDLDVTASGQTATLTWVSEVGAYEIAHALEAAADPDENIAGTATEATYTMNELALDKDHYFWVRANCGNNDYSPWVGPVSVHIGYCLPAPTSVDNSGITNVTFGVGDNVVNNSTHPTAAPYYADYTSQVGAVQAAVEATIAITYATSYTYNTYVWVDLNNNLVFEADEVICYGESTNANPTTLTLNFTIPATVATGDYRMRIGGADSGLGSNPANANPCYSSTYGIFEDYTLRVLEAPACLPVSGLTASNATAHTVDLAWTAGGDETAWVVAYKTAEEEEFTEVPASTNPFTLSGLRAETTYSVKVASDCGDSQSTYTNEITITTEVACPAPTALTVSDVTPTGATISWTGDAEGYTLRYGVPSEPDPTAPATIILTAHDVWGDGSGYQMLLDADATAYGDVFTATSGWTATSYEAFEYTIPEGAECSMDATHIVVDGSVSIQIPAGIYDWCITNPTPGDKIYIASSGGNVGGRQDDYEFQAGMTYEFVIRLDDNDQYDQTDVTVYSGGDVVWTVIENATNPVTLEDLSSETLYLIEVQASCGEEGVSEWTASSFTTLSACAVPSNLAAEATDTEATLTWSGYQDSYNIQYRTAGFDGYYINETWDGDEIGDWGVYNFESGGGINGTAGVDGTACFAFHWTQNPPQYLISPDLREGVGGKTLTFSYKAYSATYAESFMVGFAIGEEMTWEDEVATETGDTDWHEYQVVVPEGTEYFVIACTSDDAYYLYIDNIVIYAEDEVVEAGQWMTTTATGTTATITGLTAETEYEWQVQGAECTDWSASAYFTTTESTTVTVTQETALVAGWNWFSTYVEVEDPIAMLQAIEASLGENGMVIKSSDIWTENDADWGMWIGDLDEVGIENEQMYKILVSGPCTVTVEGMPVNPEEHAITINQGWNWIGFPSTVAITIDDAFAGFAQDGDIIRNSDGETPYDADWEMWIGDLETLQPGQGFMYYSANSESRRLVFPTVAKTRNIANFGSFTKQPIKTIVSNCKSKNGNQLEKSLEKK